VGENRRKCVSLQEKKEGRRGGGKKIKRKFSSCKDNCFSVTRSRTGGGGKKRGNEKYGRASCSLSRKRGKKKKKRKEKGSDVLSPAVDRSSRKKKEGKGKEEREKKFDAKPQLQIIHAADCLHFQIKGKKKKERKGGEKGKEKKLPLMARSKKELPSTLPPCRNLKKKKKEEKRRKEGRVGARGKTGRWNNWTRLSLLPIRVEKKKKEGRGGGGRGKGGFALSKPIVHLCKGKEKKKKKIGRMGRFGADALSPAC